MKRRWRKIKDKQPKDGETILVTEGTEILKGLYRKDMNFLLYTDDAGNKWNLPLLKHTKWIQVDYKSALELAEEL